MCLSHYKDLQKQSRQPIALVTSGPFKTTTKSEFYNHFIDISLFNLTYWFGNPPILLLSVFLARCYDCFYRRATRFMASELCDTQSGVF